MYNNQYILAKSLSQWLTRLYPNTLDRVLQAIAGCSWMVITELPEKMEGLYLSSGELGSRIWLLILDRALLLPLSSLRNLG